jgi:prephenate dehydrogenase
MKILTVGLGLIGGSIAKAVKMKTGHTVIGEDINTETLLMAKLSGAIDEERTLENTSDLDIIFLALRPSIAIKWLEDNADKIEKNTTVVDLCGVKRYITLKIRNIADKYGFKYIGGHPMAGKERGGFKNSTPDLFVGASMILTPDSETLPETLEILSKLFDDIGFSKVVYSTPEEHDKIIAYTSQLAHIVSSAYVKSPEASKQRGFSANSFKDMTRVAYLDEDMWTELFLENKDFLTKEVAILIDNLSKYKEALENENEEMLHALLKEGRECKIEAGGN